MDRQTNRQRDSQTDRRTDRDLWEGPLLKTGLRESWLTWWSLIFGWWSAEWKNQWTMDGQWVDIRRMDSQGVSEGQTGQRSASTQPQWPGHPLMNSSPSKQWNASTPKEKSIKMKMMGLLWRNIHVKVSVVIFIIVIDIFISCFVVVDVTSFVVVSSATVISQKSPKWINISDINVINYIKANRLSLVPLDCRILNFDLTFFHSIVDNGAT